MTFYSSLRLYFSTYLTHEPFYICPGARENLKGLYAPYTIILDDLNFVVCFFRSFQDQSGFGSEIKGV